MVYSSLGSHASYPTPKTVPRIFCVGNDYGDDGGPTWAPRTVQRVTAPCQPVTVRVPTEGATSAQQQQSDLQPSSKPSVLTTSAHHLGLPAVTYDVDQAAWHAFRGEWGTTAPPSEWDGKPEREDSFSAWQRFTVPLSYP